MEVFFKYIQLKANIPTLLESLV